MNQQATGAAGMISFFVPLILMFVIMYLLIILPQRRKEKKNREMLNALQVGNNVVTIGGIMGKIVNIKDDEITVETSVQMTKVKVKKWAIKEIEKPVEA